MLKYKYSVRAATKEDAISLAPRLRQADVDEIKAASDRDPLEAMLISIRQSRAPKAGLVDGEVVFIFGVASSSLMSVHGSPWLLASDLLVDHAKPFLRGSKDYLNAMKKNFIYLSNFVDARNTDSIRWLQWLGFDILPTQAYGPYGLMFHPFEMKR